MIPIINGCIIGCLGIPDYYGNGVGAYRLLIPVGVYVTDRESAQVASLHQARVGNFSNIMWYYYT